MPKRPRSHQLEDHSRKKFRNLFPEAWVVRDRSHDYGVDFEVEIYSDDGDATGLVFLAQLKATDAAAAADRVRMSRDQLSYLDTLEVPAAIFRFASPDDSWRWSWTFDPNVLGANDSGKTSTIRFSDEQLWNPGDPAKIVATLKVHRALRSRSPRDRVVLASADGIPARKRFEIDAALRRIADDVDCFTLDQSQDSIFTINIGMEGNQLLIALDRIATGKIPTGDPEDLQATLLYGLIGVLRGAKLHSQAEMAARAALTQNLVTSLRPLAVRAMASLTADPVAAAELAIGNGLAAAQDQVWVLAYHQLITAPASDTQRRAGVNLFSAAALEAARQSGHAGGEAAVRHNMANGCLGAGDSRGAIPHLNAARRLRPAYMRSAYFLAEIGRALYGGERYRKAAVFYRLSYDLEPGPGIKHFLADALMLGGLLAEAETFYRELHDEVGQDAISEIILKGTLCAAFQKELKTAVAPTREAAGQAWNWAATEETLKNEEALLQTLRCDNAFNPLANFNLGALRSQMGRHQDAVGFFLACAFRQSGDIQAWRNAVLASMRSSDSLMAATVIDCALRMGGLAVRDALRAEVASQAVDEAQILAWDAVLKTAQEAISKSDEGVLFRMLLGDEGEAPFKFSLR